MKRPLLLALIAALLSGCGSTLQVRPPTSIAEDKAIWSQDAPASPGMSRHIAFNKALTQAIAKPTNEHHRVLLDEGMHLVTASCMSYLTRLGNVNQTIGFTRRETALAGTLAASSLGLAGFSANAIAGTASAFGFTTATMDNFSNVYLFAPDLSAVQALVLTAMESRIEQGRVIIDDTARELSYSEVSQFLLTMESTCQPHGIQGLVTRSVASTRAVPDGAAAKVPTDVKPAIDPAAAGKTGADRGNKQLLLPPRTQAIKIVPIN